MRDPRSGPHGVAALVLTQLVAVGAVAALLDRPWLLALWPAAARAAVVPALAWLPAARPDGLGATLHAATGTVDVAVALVLAVAACILPGRQGQVALVGLAGAGAVAILWSALWWRRLGGCTGDTHGAAVELAGLAYLLGVCAALA
jgi:adenosylcobinamide-GDP ribazoletransferase